MENSSSDLEHTSETSENVDSSGPSVPEPSFQIWTDDKLLQVPALRSVYDSKTITHVMSRFHFLLSRKDPTTYKQFTKLWAYLIITSVDPFEHIEENAFKAVYNRCESGNHPIEDLELEPQYTDSPIDNSSFRETDTEVEIRDECRVIGKVTMNDRQLNIWYSDPDNLTHARVFFFIYCLNLMRGYCKTVESVLHHCQGKYWLNYGHFSCFFRPPVSPFFDAETAKYIRGAFRKPMFQKILRMLLDLKMIPSSSGTRSSFIDYSVRTPIEFVGLKIPEIFVDDLTSVREFISLVKAEGDPALDKSLKILIYMIGQINYIEEQNSEYLKLHPQFTKKECKLWPFSRAFDPKYFQAIEEHKNKEFLALLSGYKSQPGLQHLRALSGFSDKAKYQAIGRNISEKMFRPILFFFNR